MHCLKFIGKEIVHRGYEAEEIKKREFLGTRLLRANSRQE
jgi:hypothetical protein